MPYIDGFLLAIPRRKVDKYRRIARRAGKIFRKHGALEYRECLGDDLKNRMGVSFTKSARARTGEVPVFSWIVYRSKKQRDSVNAKVVKDPAMLKMMDEASMFDMKRMAYGGFRVIVDL